MKLNLFLVSLICSFAFFAQAKDKSEKRSVSSNRGPRIQDLRTIECSFTEPFYSTRFDRKDKTLFISGPGVYTKSENEEIGAIVEHKIDNVTFNRNGQIITLTHTSFNNSRIDLMRIDLSKKGSDGMSDIEYQAEGIILPNDRPEGAGGCNLLYKKDVPTKR